MLIHLEVENVAIIEKLDIPIYGNFMVLTGETGAGKSIIIDSLSALLGARVSRELIRSGTDKAFVQGLFSSCDKYNDMLDSMGIEPQEDGSILLSRVFTDSGRNVCRINGTVVTVSMLKQIGQKLVDIHGQHDNQSLLREETHIELLDSFAGEKMALNKKEYRLLLDELYKLKTKLRDLQGEGKQRERTLDTLRFQISEIESANLSVGEDKELERQSRIMAHAEDIILAFTHAYSSVHSDENEEDSAIDKIGRALDMVRNIQDLDSSYEEIARVLEDIEERLLDVSREIRIIRDKTEYDPGLHKNIEERISLIQGFRRKYGDTIEDILKYLENSKTRLDEIEKSEELILGIKSEIASLEKDLHKRCAVINKLRTQAAKRLETGIIRELNDLEMPKAQFEAAIVSCPEEGFNENGTDKVEFMFSPNVGEPIKPLSKIVSGGEMSRVMLAIKSILADIDDVPTLIFDEIDTGVSGKAASKLGEKLKKLGKNHQVICITHHAQIASQADAHYLIEKNEQSGRTITSVKLLENEQRENEITRLLSGEHVTEAARKLARELLDNM